MLSMSRELILLDYFVMHWLIVVFLKDLFDHNKYSVLLMSLINNKDEYSINDYKTYFTELFLRRLPTY